MVRMGGAKFHFIAGLGCLVVGFLLGCGGGGGGSSSGGSVTGGGNPGSPIVGLGFDSGNQFLQPIALNNKGEIVLLNANTEGGLFRSASGGVTNLSSTSPLNAVVASCLNDKSVAGGTATTPFGAAIWKAGVITNLPSPSGQSSTNTAVTSINNTNQMVGTATAPGVTNGLYWASPSTPYVALSPIGLMPLTINNSGKMVGVVITGNDDEWFSLDVASGTAATDLHLNWSDSKNVGVVGDRPAGIAINDGGTIACSTGADSTVVEISPTGVQKTILTHAVVYAMNTQGDIVGNTSVSPSVPFIYNPSKGMVTLSSLLPTNSGWSLVLVHEINDLGQVVGVGTHNGGLEGFRFQLPAGSF